MNKKYESGSRAHVITIMEYYAVTYEESFIDALTPKYGEPDEETKETIKRAERYIRDFRRLAKTLRKQLI